MQIDMHFVHPVPYISDLPLSTSTILKQIGETSLRTFSGLKIGTFSLPREPPKSSRKNREDTTSSQTLLREFLLGLK